MRNIYLTKKRKEFYTDDFKKVVSHTNPSWKLDDDLVELLEKINSNNQIQTLYSKKYSSPRKSLEYDSYLYFAFTRKVEPTILKRVIPEITTKYCLGEYFENVCYYQYFFPRENPNYSEGKSSIDLGCINNSNYFNINHIKIKYKSANQETHTDFWNDLSDLLFNAY